MKKDNLEQFILENRGALDDATPSLKVWANIDQALEKKTPVRQLVWWRSPRVAAAALVLIVAGTVMGYFMAQQQSPNKMAFDTIEEYQDVQSFYERQLQDKTVRLASFKHKDTSLTDDLAQFDKAMEELKLELLNAPKGSAEKIIHAMIQNHQAKIFVLDRVLEQLDSSKQRQNNNNGTVNL